METGNWKLENRQQQLFKEEMHSSDQLLVSSFLIELWHQSFIVQGYETKADVDAARMKGETIMQHFFDWWSKEEREVLAIETGFKLPITNHESPITISGRFDRVEKLNNGLRIIDYKTGGIRSQEEVASDLQLSIYALAAEEAFGLSFDELVMLFLHEDGVTEVVTTRSEKQLAEAVQQISTLSAGIKGREFLATPSEKSCSRCPYRGICNDAAV